MDRQELHAGWTVTAIGDLSHVPGDLRESLRTGVPATVPGCVHTDLLAAGLIRDPYLRGNERDVQWIGETAWRYTTTVEVTEQTLGREHVDLICEGLDTIATVEVNGRAVGECLSQHVTSRFDAKAALRPGENQLVVRFAAPLAYARQMEARLGPQPRTGHGSNTPHPMNFIRKMACNFGWDWGPMLVTAGIWRPIRLEAWSHSRLAAVRPHVVRADADLATVDVVVEPTYTSRHRPADVTLTLTDPRGNEIARREASGSATIRLNIPQPQRWWPVGHGSQPLYTLDVSLRDADGEVLDTWQRRIGLRTTELVADPDEAGQRFALKINGKEIFARGANWIPDDCFPTRVDEPRYRRRLEQALDLNMNILRVWGGGVFESDTFYDLCDEMGLMVWQDFLFACGCYPEDQPFPSLVEQEATDNINRLACHPSLVIWNGCNENLMIYGSREKRPEPDRPWGLGYYFDLLPKVLARLDPSRPYWHLSPYSGTIGRSVFDAGYGNVHYWSAWFGGHWSNYQKVAARFCSEFGWQAPATYATMARAMDPDADFAPEVAGWVHRQRSPKGEQINAGHVAETYNLAASRETFDDWHYLLQLNQARALTTGVEWFRSRYPVNMGTVYWQINDCWPVTSWAAIDGDGRYKPMAYATRRFYRPRLLTIQPIRPITEEAEPGPLAVYLHNDSDEPWRTSVRLEDRPLLGDASETLLEQEVTVAPRSLLQLEVPRSPAADHYLAAHADGEQSLWFARRDRELVYPKPDFDATLDGGDGRYRLTITAKSLLRDLCIFPDRLHPEATIDDQVVTLLPGQSRTFSVTSQAPLTAKQLTTPPVFQCVNGFGKAQ